MAPLSGQIKEKMCAFFCYCKQCGFAASSVPCTSLSMARNASSPAFFPAARLSANSLAWRSHVALMFSGKSRLFRLSGFNCRCSLVNQ
jgi:hypothetical protein